MPDICMCFNDTCPLRETCYRYKAKPCEYRQSYADFQPDENGHCNYFMKIWHRPRIQREGE